MRGHERYLRQEEERKFCQDLFSSPCFVYVTTRNTSARGNKSPCGPPRMRNVKFKDNFNLSNFVLFYPFALLLVLFITCEKAIKQFNTANEID